MKVQISTHVLKYLHVPRFSPKNSLHKALAEQSHLCHSSVSKANLKALAKAETKIDDLSCELWGLNAKSLQRVPTKQTDRRR
jgi:hypothetical protein